MSWGQIGTFALRLRNCTVSSATDSYQVVKSPRIFTEERPESTSMNWHLLGLNQDTSVFLGSCSQPALWDGIDEGETAPQRKKSQHL